MRDKFLMPVIFLLLVTSVHATTGEYLSDTLEFTKVNREAMFGSLEILNKRVSELERITNSLQLHGLHEESLKLLLDVRKRKRLIEEGEYVSTEDLTVRASALESEIHKTIEKESLQHTNTNAAPEYQEINSILEDAIKKKDVAALANALLAYRIELQNTPREQQRRLEEFQKSNSAYRRVRGTIALVVLISALISFIVYQKSARRKRDREYIEAFIAQERSNPSSVSRSLIEDRAVQKFLNKRISDAERRIIGD